MHETAKRQSMIRTWFNGQQQSNKLQIYHQITTHTSKLRSLNSSILFFLLHQEAAKPRRLVCSSIKATCIFETEKFLEQFAMVYYLVVKMHVICLMLSIDTLTKKGYRKMSFLLENAWVGCVLPMTRSRVKWIKTYSIKKKKHIL